MHRAIYRPTSEVMLLHLRCAIANKKVQLPQTDRASTFVSPKLLAMGAWSRQLHAPTRWRPISTVPNERVSSNVYLRALFCLLVARSSFPLYILFTEQYIDTSVKMSRYIRSTSKNKLYYRIPPIFFPTSNHNLPGRRRGCRRPPAVGWPYLSIIT